MNAPILPELLLRLFTRHPNLPRYFAALVKLTITHTDPLSRARAGWFQTGRGQVPTPIFMPVGTRAAVKALRARDLRELGAEIILGNTYHLYLRPGTEVLGQLGGLHKFAVWDRPILTDSGGFQVYSLEDLRRIDADGVTFRSHIDGSEHRFTPESVVETQRAIGSDIAMVLDECPPSTAPREHQERAMEGSMRWAARARAHHLREPYAYGVEQAQFGIVQGGTQLDLRSRSVEALRTIGFDGYAIGGLAVGETTETMYEVVEHTAPLLPADQPRYLMGVGTPENLLECIARGVDMFDCVMPTRNARNGTLFTSTGKLNLRNARHRTDERPVDERCDCETCRTVSRAYLRHLFNVDEITGLTLATLHNVRFYLRLMEMARERIADGSYTPWMQATLGEMAQGRGVGKE